MLKNKNNHFLFAAAVFFSLSIPTYAANHCETFSANTPQDFTKIKFSKVLEIEPLTPGFAVLEGPVWVGDALWVTHIGTPSDNKPNPSDIMAYRNGKLRVEKKSYGANGMSFDGNGQLVAARHFDGTITRVKDGKILAAKYNNKRFNSPNDLVISSAGDIYFSDPDWQNPKPTQNQELMYHVSKKGEVVSFGSIMEKPNGLMLSQDETTLYTGAKNGLFKYAINPDGSVKDAPQQIAKQKIPAWVDGMSRDCAGNIYVTAEGKVHVLAAKTDKVLASYEVPNATNIAFGGKKHTTLFVTTLGEKPSLWQAEGTIPGLPY